MPTSASTSMETISLQMQHRRLLLHNTTTAPTSHNSTATAQTTSSFDPSTVAIIALAFFSFVSFIGFVFVYIRRAFSQGEERLPATSSSSAPTKGLDRETIKALPALPYSDKLTPTSECVVCLSAFEEGERVKVLPSCGHSFHPWCIESWLVSRGSCPLCRSVPTSASWLASSGRREKVSRGAREEADGTQGSV